MTKRALRRENERMREALKALTFYLAAPHREIGHPCGVDACVVCLAESTVTEALKPC